MKSQPLVSIVVPVYNKGAFLDECLQSLVNQTYLRVEIIAIDDGSTDACADILARWKKRDKRIRLMTHVNNKGISYTSNRGLRVAKGKYIARMDADDVAMPERIALQVEFMERSSDIFLVGGGAVNINETGEELGHFTPLCTPDEIDEILPHRNPIYHPTIMYRNDGTVQYRSKFDMVEDYDMYLRLLTLGKRMINLPHVFVKYRVGSNNCSFGKKELETALAEKAREFYWQRKETGKDACASFEREHIV